MALMDFRDGDETDERIRCWLVELKFRFKDKRGFEWNLNGGQSNANNIHRSKQEAPSM